MNKLREIFAAGKGYMVFLTCGDPSLQETQRQMRQAAAEGAAAFLLAVPFSDPTAEEAEAQEASIRALAAGTTVDGIFDMLGEMAGEALPPVVLKTYANVVFSYGAARFFEQCAALGVAALMVVDLPFEERGEFAAESAASGVALVSGVAPAPRMRLAEIAEGADACFVLLPGAADACDNGQLVSAPENIANILRAHRPLPVIGQANSAPQAQAALAYCDGVIMPPSLLTETIRRCV